LLAAGGAAPPPAVEEALVGPAAGAGALHAVRTVRTPPNMSPRRRIWRRLILDG
jgi:hypothetical protein